jgi:hypothetical protein
MLDRILAGLAVCMTAATLAIAFLFRFDGYAGAFDRLSRSLGFAFGYWVVAAVVAGLIYLAAAIFKVRAPMVEVFFVLVCGGCAVGILEALR